MLLYLSLLGFLLAGILLVFSIKKHQSSKYLAAFFLLVSLYKLNEYVILYSGSVFWNAVISSNFTFLHYLIGPFFYFYSRSIIHQRKRISRLDLVHFIPAFVFLIALIPYISTPFKHKIEIGQLIANSPGFLSSFKPTILSDWFSVKIIYLSRPFSILAYSLYSLWIYISSKIDLKNQAPSSQDRLMHKWLIVLFLVVPISFIFHWLIVFYSFQEDISILYLEGNLLMQLSYLSFTLLIISPLLFPQILYGIMYPDQEQARNIGPNLNGMKVEYEKPQPNVDKEYFNQIGILVGEFLAERKSYLLPGYNLNQLADEMNLPVHHLSYYFREIRQQNFTDYKNELRVKYACELIMNEKFKEMTLEAIGEKAGFSSRVTFLRAFKKVTNQTPGNFKISMKQASPEEIE